MCKLHYACFYICVVLNFHIPDFMQRSKEGERKKNNGGVEKEREGML